jgi:DDE family transposase
MAGRRKEPLTESNVRQGQKYLRSFQDILEPLAQLPSHGNRKFHYDDWVCLLLLHFFNPVLNSLRSLAEATGFEGIQDFVGVGRTSLGSMSDSAAKLFDPAYLEPILQELGSQVERVCRDKRLENLPGVPTAVDGSFLRCLPKMVWAVFRKKSDNRGVRLHLHYDIVRGIPSASEITQALGSEKKSLRKLLKEGMLYLTDRGYIDYGMYQAIHDAGSFFVSRIKDNSTYEVLDPRPLTEADRKAGVTSDAWVRMGSEFTEGQLTAPVRRVVIAGAPGRKDVVLLTNTDLAAEMIGVLYRYRWQVELFFRWFKCILGCRNWLSLTLQGLTLQVYVALLASILMALWTGLKPTRSAFRVICLYFQGWVNDEELLRHLAALKKIS